MSSALQGVLAQHLSSWIQCSPTASSVTGQILEVLPIINLTLPGNSESYSDRLRERLDSSPETPPHHRGHPSVAWVLTHMGSPGTGMWSVYCSGRWFRTENGASTVGTSEYETLRQTPACAQQNRPSGNDTVNRQETRNSWKDCSWHCVQSGNIHTCVQGRIPYRHQNGKVCYIAAPTGNKHRAPIFQSRTFAPAPSASP